MFFANACLASFPQVENGADNCVAFNAGGFGAQMLSGVVDVCANILSRQKTTSNNIKCKRIMFQKFLTSNIIFLWNC